MGKRKLKIDGRMIGACERANAMGGRVLNYEGKRLVVAFDDDEAFLYEVDGKKYTHLPGNTLLRLNRQAMGVGEFETLCAQLVGA